MKYRINAYGTSKENPLLEHEAKEVEISSTSMTGAISKFHREWPATNWTKIEITDEGEDI